MHWKDMFNRSLRQDIADTKAVAEEARSAALLAQEAAENVERSLRVGLPYTESARHLAGLALFCVLTLCIGGGITLQAIRGFQDPLIIDSKAGTIQLYLESEPLKKGQVLPFEEPIQTSIELDATRREISYLSAVPRSLSGHRFVIVLTGGAMINELRAVDILESRPATGCQQYPDPVGSSDQREPCQLLSGVVPSTPVDESEVCASYEESDRQKNYAQIKFSGEYDVETESDWAHRIYTIPSVRARDFQRPTLAYNGYPLGGLFASPVVNSCQSLQLWPNESVAEEDQLSPFRGPDFLNRVFWDQGTYGATISARRDYSQALGNLLLAVGAALVALSLGFIPVTYQARRVYKYERRTRHETWNRRLP